MAQFLQFAGRRFAIKFFTKKGHLEARFGARLGDPL